MITKAEAQEIKVDIALLKRSTSDTLSAIRSQSESQKELVQSVNLLTVEIREDRVKREAHEIKVEDRDTYIHEKITSNTKRLDYFTENYKQPIEKLIVTQNRKDKFVNAMFSKTGGSVFLVVGALFVYFLDAVKRII
tara:strand:+ start:8774 stop:9184 length:411 start_codon:yes stop_codon:yes gene_type:complete